jgi:hypothetical protein
MKQWSGNSIAQFALSGMLSRPAAARIRRNSEKTNNRRGALSHLLIGARPTGDGRFE